MRSSVRMAAPILATAVRLLGSASVVAAAEPAPVFPRRILVHQ